MHRSLAEAIALFEARSSDCSRPEDRVLVEKYLAALAPVLADAVLGRDVLGRLDSVERLFGHTWLRDADPFDLAFDKWRQFRSEYEAFALGGMTVRERLHALSLAEEFDRAEESGDEDAVVVMLRRIRVDEASIASVLDNMRRGR